MAQAFDDHTHFPLDGLYSQPSLTCWSSQAIVVAIVSSTTVDISSAGVGHLK